MRELAIVTGGTRGIGRAIVTGLLEAGYEVYYTFNKNKLLSDELERKFPDVAKGFQLDSSNWEAVKEFSKTILAKQTPAVLINNVGINDDSLFANQTLETYWKIIKLNLGSAICFSKCFINAMMQKRSGHIINISSVASIKPKIGNGAYGASKAAIERFSKTLALEVARFNVRVNCVSPAYVQTDLFDEFIKDKDKSEFYKSIPMRKILDTTDISNLVLALCKEEIKTTGSVFYVGNGENIVN